MAGHRDTQTTSPRAKVLEWLSDVAAGGSAIELHHARGGPSSLRETERRRIHEEPAGGEPHAQAKEGTFHKHTRLERQGDGCYAPSRPGERGFPQDVEKGYPELIGLQAAFRQGTDDYGQAQRLLRGKRRRASVGNSSYIEPMAGPDQAPSPQKGPREPSGTITGRDKQARSGRDEELANARGKDAEAVEEPYAKRRRRKTRPELYEPQPPKPRKERKPRTRIRASGNRGSVARRDAGRLPTFDSKYISGNRLTLKPSYKFGLFSHGRSSSLGKDRGPGDLAFNEMRFLQKNSESWARQTRQQRSSREVSEMVEAPTVREENHGGPAPAEISVAHGNQQFRSHDENDNPGRGNADLHRPSSTPSSQPFTWSTSSQHEISEGASDADVSVRAIPGSLQTPELREHVSKGSSQHQPPAQEREDHLEESRKAANHCSCQCHQELLTAPLTEASYQRGAAARDECSHQVLPLSGNYHAIPPGELQADQWKHPAQEDMNGQEKVPAPSLPRNDENLVPSVVRSSSLNLVPELPVGAGPAPFSVPNIANMRRQGGAYASMAAELEQTSMLQGHDAAWSMRDRFGGEPDSSWTQRSSTLVNGSGWTSEGFLGKLYTAPASSSRWDVYPEARPMDLDYAAPASGPQRCLQDDTGSPDIMGEARARRQGSLENLDMMELSLGETPFWRRGEDPSSFDAPEDLSSLEGAEVSGHGSRVADRLEFAQTARLDEAFLDASNATCRPDAGKGPTSISEAHRYPFADYGPQGYQPHERHEDIVHTAPLTDTQWCGGDEDAQRHGLFVHGDQDDDVPRAVGVPGEPDMLEEGLMLPFWRPNWLY